MSMRFQTTYRTYYQSSVLKGGSTRLPAFRPVINPPPYGWEGGGPTIMRSTSRDTFLPPGNAIQVGAVKPRPSSAQPVWQTEPIGRMAALTTTYGSTHQGFHGVRPRKPFIPSSRAVEDNITDSPLAFLGRSTSQDSFQAHTASVRSSSRQPLYRPPHNQAPYSSVDALGMGIQRSTSEDAFKSFPDRVFRQPAFIPPQNRAPFSSEDAADDRTPTSTYRDLFQSLPNRPREPCRPRNTDSVGSAIFGDEAYA